MFELVLHHNYQVGAAIDISENGNHGQLDSTTQTAGRNPGGNALYLDGIGSRIVVAPSDTLSNLRAIRATAWIWVEEFEQRRNIMEGFLSFAFFINPDASLQATVYNGSDWQGVQSAPGVIPLQNWTHVKYIYDGINTSVLYVNDVLIASEYRHLGLVQSISGPYGLNIGAWPGPDAYMFKGKIDEVKLWRYDQDVTEWLIFGKPMTDANWEAWSDIFACTMNKEFAACLNALLELLQKALHDMREDNEAVVWEQLEFSKKFFDYFVEDPTSTEMETLIVDHMKFLSLNVPQATWQRLFQLNKGLEQMGCIPEECQGLAELADPNLKTFAKMVDQAVETHILPLVPPQFWPSRL